MQKECVLGRSARVASLALLALLFAASSAFSGPPDAAPDIVVDAARSLRPTGRGQLGINIDYFLDADSNRRPGARPLARAILDMGVGSLRYPGGEKSDGVLWAAPPFFRKAGPVLVRQGPGEWPSNDLRVYNLAQKRFIKNPLDLDAFIRLCRATGAEPVLVVPYDAMYRPPAPGGSAPDLATLLQNAVSLVRHANIERGYGVKYWEIGNEPHFYVYNGGARAADYARDLVIFASAMKGVDPAIRIGAAGPVATDGVGALDNLSGDPTPWWKPVFEQAAGSIDFIAVHEYPCYEWFNYDTYRTTPVKMQGVDAIEAAANKYGPPGLAGRLRYLLTEVNSADWYAHPQNLGWKHENTLGHGLVLFDMLAQAVADPRIVTTQIWTTRWLGNDASPELWDALDNQNRLLPTGAALKLLADRLPGGQLVPASDAPGVRAVAIRNHQTLTLYLINKDTARDVAVRIDGGRPGPAAARTVWAGSGPNDHHPVLRQESPVPIVGRTLRVALPAVSLTVLTLPCTSAGRGSAPKFAGAARPGPRQGAALHPPGG